MATTASSTSAVRTTVAAAYVPSAARLEAAMLTVDGAFYVGAKYLASATDAAKRRRLEAERLRREAIRGIPAAHRAIRSILRRAMDARAVVYVAPVAAHQAAPVCPWCSRAILGDEAVVETGGRQVHADRCAAELDVVLGEG